jgi:enterochelin esterase-like enzyme
MIISVSRFLMSVTFLLVADFRCIQAQEQLTRSEILNSITKRIRSGERECLPEFWNSLGKGKSPLIESAGNSDELLITFVFPDSSHIDKVRLVSNIVAEGFTGMVENNLDNLGYLKLLADTDIWFISFTLNKAARAPYAFEVLYKSSYHIRRRIVPDSFNPRRHANQCVFDLSSQASPWENIPTGKWIIIDHRSSILQRTEKLYVYIPVAIDTLRSRDLPLFIGLSSVMFGLEIPIHQIVETLSKENLIRPPLVVSFNFPTNDNRSRFDTLALFIKQELIPLLSQRYPVSKKPENILLAGASRQGLAAAYVATTHPEIIGNVLSLSGTFFWRPSPTTPFEWLAHELSMRKRLAVKFFIAVGTLETIVTTRNRGHYPLSTNRHFRNVLHAKGYTYQYNEFHGVHHPFNWQFEIYNGTRYLLSK